MAFLDDLKQLVKLNFNTTQKGKSVIGIDIGSSSIKVVQLRKDRGVAVLETYGELALGPYGGLEIGQATNLGAGTIANALKDLMREANVTTKDCAVSIPFSSSLISIIELPKRDEKELARMIPIEARKYIPVPISEVQLDWFIIPEESAKYFSSESKEEEDEKKTTGKVSALIVAIHNETLNKYRTILKEAALSPTFFEIEIFSAVRAIIDRGVHPTVILDIGAASTKLYIVEYGIVKVSHTINKGSQDITLALSQSGNSGFRKAEETKRTRGILDAGGEASETQNVKQASLLTLEYIFAEANRMMLGYQKRFNQTIEKVVFTGGGSSIQGLLALAEKHFEVPVETADPFSQVETPAFLEEILNNAGPTFAVAVGLALRKLQEEE